jgi:hypothetical protein
MSYLKKKKGDCSRERNVHTLVFKTKSLSKCNVITELNMEKIHLQIMLSHADYRNFKRLVVFCIGKEQED